MLVLSHRVKETPSEMPHKPLNFLFILAAIFVVSFCDLPPLGMPPTDSKKATKLPPCKACSELVQSFLEGMKRTERNKHDGGDAAWEEERLGSYKTSEIRLVEIQEKLCTDLKRGEDQCHQLAEDNEALFEWWFKNQDEDLHKYLCIDQLKVCCPEGFYGPQCDPCTDCKGNGKCKGTGTRKGNGKCACDTGYEGESCSKCAVQFYESFKDESKLLCSSCFKACGDTGCTGAGPQNCLNCRTGWRMQNDDDIKAAGCQDIDECYEQKHPCSRNQFCVNSEGSFSCLDCDKSCIGCSGDGPDLCDQCAIGFELRDGMCLGRTLGVERELYTFLLLNPALAFV